MHSGRGLNLALSFGSRRNRRPTPSLTPPPVTPPLTLALSFGSHHTFSCVSADSGSAPPHPCPHLTLTLTLSLGSRLALPPLTLPSPWHCHSDPCTPAAAAA